MCYYLLSSAIETEFLYGECHILSARTRRNLGKPISFRMREKGMILYIDTGDGYGIAVVLIIRLSD